jgi:DNA N-6-adenine-methyltransferase (Dam)
MKTGFTHESQAAMTTSWYTPRHIFEMLNLEFDLDPCAPQGGVPWIPAKNHYALPQDGLALPWDGLVWCNPPYGKETQLWLKKLAEHGDGIGLAMSRTDTKWFHDCANSADCLLFLKGRIKFVDGLEQTGGSGNTSGSVLIGYGEIAFSALAACKDFGFFVSNR